MTCRLAVALILFGCLGVAMAQPRIVVSIHPYYDLTRRIAGPGANVVRLLPPGASPHAFDPTPGLVAEIERADLVVLNGGVDEWALELVTAGANGPSVLELLPLYEGLEDLAATGDLDARELSGDTEHQEQATHAEQATHEEQARHQEHAETPSGHDHEGVNPHIWLDPVLMEQAVGAIAARLMELDPDRVATYRQNAAELTSQLRALHAELQLILAPARDAAFIPFHDAWPYFAARYGLDLVLEIEPFPGREPGPRYLAGVVEAIETSGAPAIFAEAQLGERPARVIALEADVDVHVLDPVGGVEGRNSYEELLRYNARVIADALGTP